MTTPPDDDARFIQQLPYRRLDAFAVASEVLTLANEIAGSLPRGYAPLADQLRRSSQSAYLQTTEGSARFGADQRARLLNARAEAVEAASTAEGIAMLKLVESDKCWRLVGRCARLAAILMGMARR
jgi:four helix bundle protein